MIILPDRSRGPSAPRMARSDRARIAHRSGAPYTVCPRAALILLGLGLTALVASAQSTPRFSRPVGPFPQPVAETWDADDGAPTKDLHAIAVDGASVWVAAGDRLFRYQGSSWSSTTPVPGHAIEAFAVREPYLYLVAGGEIHWLTTNSDRSRSLGLVPNASDLALGDGLPPEIWIASRAGVALNRMGSTRALGGLPGANEARSVAVAPGHSFSPTGTLAAAASDSGLFAHGTRASPNEWIRLTPRDDRRSWNPVDVRFVVFDTLGRLWFGSPTGLGMYDFDTSAWSLFDGTDGLPWSGFTAATAGPDGDVWLGTDRGLVHWSDGEWEYRQGRRWLPEDRVIDLAVDDQGNVWTATAAGVSVIRMLPMTLAEKARRFEVDIDRFHRRTPWGYVGWVSLPEPGVTTEVRQHSSDNDGLWTAMYGAAECYAWAATRSAAARDRARRAFEALRFLGEVTQGGDPAPPPGFVARSILPADGPDPNVGRLEEDRRHKAERDANWKLIDPRWPVSADGQWYWKSDTSSDELDGHFFFYALYYDLVADTDQERAEVRAVVTSIVDHLIEHDFSLIDHDGLPTRWSVFGPDALNHDRDWWEERGLNSLSMLSYLRIAEHMTGDPRYAATAKRLIEDHGYAANVRVPKIHSGFGSGNQSDDEMAFMGFYHLIGYERDSALREIWAHSFDRYWELEAPERNPLFNFMWAARTPGIRYADAFEDRDLGPTDDRWLLDAIDSLQRYPLDRIDWRLDNSHRLDVVTLAGSSVTRPRGHLRDGRVLPIDERFVGHWNHDPWQLYQGGEGHRLADGASFLLPYYMGLYHGFLTQTGE